MTGYWGEPTATTDFCEPNYAVSFYVAEFYNAFSSLPLCVVSVCGVRHCILMKLGVEQALCYAVVGVIGLGSVAFHATLTREGQVLDELPMLWVILLFIAALLHADDYRTQSRPGSARLAMPWIQECQLGAE